MKILYLHGFGSNFDNNSNKILALKQIGDVIGFNNDYTKSYDTLLEEFVSNQIEKCCIDLIVGTSLGGFFAASCGYQTQIPFIALNPVIHPSLSLGKRIGSHIDYTGKPYILSKEIVDNYPAHIETKGHGLILLERGDELIDPIYSSNFLSPFYHVILSENGSHRFENLQDRLVDIQNFLNQFS